MILTNIQSGFRVTAIYPLVMNIFPKDESLASDVTDRSLDIDEFFTATEDTTLRFT